MPRTDVPPAHGGAGRAAHRRRGRGHLRRPGRAAPRTTPSARAVAHPAPRRRRRAVLLDLRAGRRARRGSASARCPAASSPPGWCTRCGRATRSRCCRRRPFTPDLDAPGHHVLVAAGSGITPMLSLAASRARRAGRVRGHPLLRQPAHQHGDVRRRAGRPEGPYPARLQLVHVLSREPREAELTSGRLDAAKLRALLPAPSTSTASTTGGCAARTAWSTDARRCWPSSACRAAGCTRSCSTSTTSRPPPVRARRAPPAGPGRRGHRRPRRPHHHRRRAARHRRSSTPPSGSAPTCRSPARAASAAPAGPGSPTARSRCAATTRWSRRRSTPGYVLTCQSLPVSDASPSTSTPSRRGGRDAGPHVAGR